MVLVACFQKRHAFAHQGVEQDDSWFIVRKRPSLVKCVNDCLQVIAVDTLHMPTKCLPLIYQWFKLKDVVRWTIGLLTIDVDQIDEVGEFVMRS
ncbi:hypothetical protein D3C76_1554120 [compost metagenome]